MRSKNPDLMRQIKEFIEDCFDDSGSTPTVRQIASAMRIAKTTAHRYLVDMAEREMIEYSDGVISTDKIRKMTPPSSHAGLTGAVPCGSPDECDEQIELYMTLPIAIFGNGDFYILRASGDSMIDADISHGDLIIIDRQKKEKVGDIVVALTEGHENTLKRLQYDYERECYYLHPENTAYEDIYVNDLDIRGVARYVIKEL